jgi:hypothetical protein
MAEGGDREQELAALHRSYRMMETDRQKYSEESQVPPSCPLSASACPPPLPLMLSQRFLRGQRATSIC